MHVMAGDLWGGKEAQMYAQLQAVAKLGWKISVLLFQDGEVARRYREAGLECSILDEKLGLRSLIVSARELARKLKPSIVVSHGHKETIIGAAMCNAAGSRLVVTFHGAAEPYPGLAGTKMLAYQQLMRLTGIYYARRIVSVSETLAKMLRLDKVAKTSVILNVVAGGKNLSAVPELEHPAIVAVGRLVKVKRFDNAIRMLGELNKLSAKPYHLYLVGDGAEEKELRALVSSLGLDKQVTLMGFRNDAEQLIGAADLFLITSDSEGIPTVLLEAISRGIPIVSTPVGGIPEVLVKFPGYPFRLGAGPGGLAYAAAELADVKPASAESVRAVMEKYFSPEAAAASHEKLYSEVLASV